MGNQIFRTYGPIRMGLRMYTYPKQRENKTMIYTTKISGSVFTVDTKEGTLRNQSFNRSFSKEQMNEAKESFKGSNRIHKPMALLFWTDCMNGHAKNWNLI